MSFVADLLYAARGLARRPAMAAVAAGTLAIGIAANAVIFGAVDQLLLRAPTHVLAPERVKRVYFHDVNETESGYGTVTTYPVLSALRQGTTAFKDLAAYGFRSEWSLGAGAEARGVWVQLVSGNYFRLLGVRPELGRTFSDDDDRIPVGEQVAIVSHAFWEQQLGSDSSAIGHLLPLQGKQFVVVGVLPRGFSGLDRETIDVWLPISSVASETIGAGWYNTTNSWWAEIVGRLHANSSESVAAGQATAVYRGLLREWKHEWRDSTRSSIVLSSVIASWAPTGFTPESKVSLWLMGVSFVVLLIAGSNVANLLVARTLERQREIAVRLALGVSRGRLARMLLAEAGLLAAIGAAAAIIIGAVASRFVQDVLLPTMVWHESIVDARVFAFTLGITLLCMLFAGLAPAFEGVRTDVTEGLKSSARQVASRHGRLRFALLLVQTALSVILLVGAGLFVTSLRKVVGRDVGVDHDRLVQVTMPLQEFGFDSARVEQIFATGMERVGRIPGVTRVAVARMTYPLGSATAAGFEVPGVETPELQWGGPYNSAVTSGFFATIGVRFVRGRDFTPDEERTGARVIVVTETLARAYWPGRDPIGQCVIFGSDDTCSPVIGVVGNVLQFNLLNDDRALAYAPPTHPGVNGLPGSMLIRTDGDPASVIEPVRRELQALAPTMPYVKAQPYSALLAPQLQPWRLGATMFTIFGAIAVFIAAIGLYSSMAYWVAQRTHEFGVRMALGAQRRDVVRLVAIQCGQAVVAGLLVGGTAALMASRWLVDLLYDTSPTDPRVFVVVAGVLAIAAMVATIVPARRSTAIDPAQAIRAE